MKRDRTILAFIIGVLLLGFPALPIVERAAADANGALLYLYLMGAWLALVAAAWLLNRRPRP